jgi:hypothetical protein
VRHKILYSNQGEQFVLSSGFHWDCIFGCEFVLQGHLDLICIHVSNIELEVAVLGPMPSISAAATCIAWCLPFVSGINIHQNGIARGGV